MHGGKGVVEVFGGVGHARDHRGPSLALRQRVGGGGRRRQAVVPLVFVEKEERRGAAVGVG